MVHRPSLDKFKNFLLVNPYYRSTLESSCIPAWALQKGGVDTIIIYTICITYRSTLESSCIPAWALQKGGVDTIIIYTICITYRSTREQLYSGLGVSKRAEPLVLVSSGSSPALIRFRLFNKINLKKSHTLEICLPCC